MAHWCTRCPNRTRGRHGILGICYSRRSQCLIFGKWGSVIATTKAQITSFIIAVALSTAAGFLFTTEFAEPDANGDLTSSDRFHWRDAWQPFSDENIMLDSKAYRLISTADWCWVVSWTECLGNWNHSQRNERPCIVPVKADWTRSDETISRWLKEYGKASSILSIYQNWRNNTSTWSIDNQYCFGCFWLLVLLFWVVGVHNYGPWNHICLWHITKGTLQPWNRTVNSDVNTPCLVAITGTVISTVSSNTSRIWAGLAGSGIKWPKEISLLQTSIHPSQLEQHSTYLGRDDNIWHNK